MIGIITILGTLTMIIIHSGLKDITIELRYKNKLLEDQNEILKAERFRELQSEQLSLCQCDKPSPDIMYGKTCTECCLEINPKA